MRQWVDLGGLAIDVDLADTGKSVGALNVHGAGSANTLAAGATESKSWVDLVLDLDQSIEHHGSTRVHVDLIGLQLGLLGRLIRVLLCRMEIRYI